MHLIYCSGTGVAPVTLTTLADRIAAWFGVPDPPLLRTRYNVAPGQVIAVVGLKPEGNKRGIACLRWGLGALE